MPEENGRTEAEIAAAEAVLLAEKEAEAKAAAGAVGSGADDEPDDEETTLTERERREIAKRKRANEQAEKLRLENLALKKEKEERDREKMTEDQRIKADLAKALKDAEDAKAEIVKARLETAAVRMGFIDPEDAQLVKAEILGDGTPEEINLALKELLARKPHLKGEAKTGDTPKGGNPAGSAVKRADENRAAELKQRFGY